MARNTTQEKFLLFCLLLIIVGVGFVIYFWGGNGFYSNAYQPVVQRSVETRKHLDEVEDSRSREPRPAGFRESDIEKRHGDRYATY